MHHVSFKWIDSWSEKRLCTYVFILICKHLLPFSQIRFNKDKSEKIPLKNKFLFFWFHWESLFRATLADHLKKQFFWMTFFPDKAVVMFYCMCCKHIGLHVLFGATACCKKKFMNSLLSHPCQGKHPGRIYYCFIKPSATLAFKIYSH